MILNSWLIISLIEKEVVSLIEKEVIDETCANLTQRENRLVTLLNKDKTPKKPLKPLGEQGLNFGIFDILIGY